jgi:hypothetical protein
MNDDDDSNNNERRIAVLADLAETIEGAWRHFELLARLVRSLANDLPEAPDTDTPDDDLPTLKDVLGPALKVRDSLECIAQSCERQAAWLHFAAGQVVGVADERGEVAQ